MHISCAPKNNKQNKTLPIVQRRQQSTLKRSPVLRQGDSHLSPHNHHFLTTVPVAKWLRVVEYTKTDEAKGRFLARCLYHPLMKSVTSDTVKKYSILYSMK